MSFSYVEQCKSVVSEIDPTLFAASQLGSVVGFGGTYRFHSLGKHLLTSAELSLGVKIPTSRSLTPDEIELQFGIMHRYLNFVVEDSPHFTQYLPRFSALLKVEGDVLPKAIITEDLSDGKRKIILPKPASQNVRNQLYAPFSDIVTYEAAVNKEVCDSSLAFDVDGLEKLLDFTPSPITTPVTFLPRFADVRSVLNSAIKELVVTIPADSTLGLDLARTAFPVYPER